jgi:hypothetical protein
MASGGGLPLGLLLLGAWPLSMWAKHRLGENWDDVVTFREAPVGTDQRAARIRFAIGAVLLIVASSLLFRYMLDHVVF